jgi:hypothetical protein
MIKLKIKIHPWLLMGLIGILLAVGSIHVNTRVRGEHIIPGTTLIEAVHMSSLQIPEQDVLLSAYQSPEPNEEGEIEPEEPVCDPSDRECACTLSFIPTEYGIFAITMLLIGIILFLVIIDILNIKKTEIRE